MGMKGEVSEFKCGAKLRLFDISGAHSLGRVKLVQSREAKRKIIVIDNGEDWTFQRIHSI